jgi:hypothetical protein
MVPIEFEALDDPADLAAVGRTLGQDEIAYRFPLPPASDARVVLVRKVAGRELAGGTARLFLPFESRRGAERSDVEGPPVGDPAGDELLAVGGADAPADERPIGLDGGVGLVGLGALASAVARKAAVAQETGKGLRADGAGEACGWRRFGQALARQHQAAEVGDHPAEPARKVIESHGAAKFIPHARV